ncbi:hypothetical protein BC829DRAFT_52185 [Chytridium lagenaria]|nr:hypothetical protein BC829DRAFT_52185 [Chytridium lagenaria]
MVKQQQKALIEARNLKSAKNQQPYVPPTSAAPTPNEAVNATPVTASSAEFKAASIPARRNSLRNLKIMTPHAAAENHAQRAGHEGSAATAPPGPAPPSLPGTAMNGGAPATAGYAHPTSHISHPQPHQQQLHPPTRTIRNSPRLVSLIRQGLENPFRLATPPSSPIPSPHPLATNFHPVISPSPTTPPLPHLPPHPPPPIRSLRTTPRSPHPLFATDRSKAHLHQPSTSHPKSPNSAYPTSAHPGFSSTPFSTISKSNFMGAFEGLYDAAEELPRLSGTLREQIRRSSSLLQTLQASGAMIEGLVRGLFRECRRSMGRSLGRRWLI